MSCPNWPADVAAQLMWWFIQRLPDACCCFFLLQANGYRWVWAFRGHQRIVYNDYRYTFGTNKWARARICECAYVRVRQASWMAIMHVFGRTHFGTPIAGGYLISNWKCSLKCVFLEVIWSVYNGRGKGIRYSGVINSTTWIWHFIMRPVLFAIVGDENCDIL